jgi:hypothetical protein
LYFTIVWAVNLHEQNPHNLALCSYGCISIKFDYIHGTLIHR